MNLGLLYQEKVGRLRSAGKMKEAREAALQVTRYNRDASSFVTLGSIDYSPGEKPTALAEFRMAIELDPAVRGRFENPATGGGRGQMLRPLLEDREFLKQVLQK
jgi:hypothetical protein